MKEKEKYVAPVTLRARVEVETGICAGSNVTIDPTVENNEPGNIEVQEYATVDHDVTFN